MESVIGAGKYFVENDGVGGAILIVGFIIFVYGIAKVAISGTFHHLYCYLVSFTILINTIFIFHSSTDTLCKA